MVDLSRPACGHVKQSAKRSGVLKRTLARAGPGFFFARDRRGLGLERPADDQARLPADLADTVSPAHDPGARRRHPHPHDETCEALFMTSGFVYDDAAEAEAAFTQDGSRYVYSRYRNPTVAMFEERLRLLEGAEACRAHGERHGGGVRRAAVPAARRATGSCRAARALRLVPLHRLRIAAALGDRDRAGRRPRPRRLGSGARPAAQRCVSARARRTRRWRSSTSPRSRELTHRAGGLLIVDNVFATPLLQKPLELGADVVVYSATKHIDGQGRSLGGAILASEKFIKDDLGLFYRHTGPSLSPFNAWLLLKGLETLELRVERQCRTAAASRALSRSRIRRSPACSIPGCRATRNTSWRSAR